MSTFVFWISIFLCLEAVHGQVSVNTLVEGRLTQPRPGVYDFLGSVTLIRDGSYNIVVDTPSGSDAGGTATMLSALSRNGLTPRQIQQLVITHGHPDHFGNDGLFANSRQLYNLFNHVGTTYTQLPYQNGTTQLTTNVQVWQTPGHMPQDVSVVVRNVPRLGRVAVVGDLFFDAADALNPQTAQVGLAWDISKLKASRTKVLCAVDHIVPGHGPIFQITSPMRTIANCGMNAVVLHEVFVAKNGLVSP